MRTVRDECLDWILIVSRRQLQRVLDIYVDHYNRERPHRALALAAPDPPAPPALLANSDPPQVHRTDRLGGLLHEYHRAA